MGLESEADQLELARRVIEQELSVRRLEAMVRDWKKPEQPSLEQPAAGKEAPAGQEYVADLEQKLRRRLGTQVRIKDRGQGKGRIEIEFYSFEDFERLMELLEIPLA